MAKGWATPNPKKRKRLIAKAEIAYIRGKQRQLARDKAKKSQEATHDKRQGQRPTLRDAVHGRAG